MEEQSRRPKETPFNQQSLPSLSPLFTPWHIIGIYLAVAAFFIPLGAGLIAVNKHSHDYKYQYDGPGTQSPGMSLLSHKIQEFEPLMQLSSYSSL
jgi:hypothetical protein